jgi:hypothetical protein
MGKDNGEQLFFVLFRRWRHDLLNELQILSGHIQLGRSGQELLDDTWRIVENVQSLSRMFACGDESLALRLWACQQQAEQAGLSFSLEVAPLARKPASSALQVFDQLTEQIVQDILLLPDEDRWLHVALDAEQMGLRFICAALPGTAATCRLSRHYGCSVSRNQSDETVIQVSLESDRL